MKNKRMKNLMTKYVFVSKELFSYLYLDLNLSQRKISCMLKIPRRTIRHYLDYYGLVKDVNLVKQSMEFSFFKKGNLVNLGRERPDLVGNNFAKGLTGELSGRWMGDSVGYFGVHQWLYSRFGKASRCELHLEHIAKRFEWANISGKYLRNKNDFIMLCPSCHRKFDAGTISMEVIKNVKK